jgi:AraC family transcriptional regulator, regulatory protein of adaptative response / methylphosphotriester-DNA alkyltransferase methyltransferase
MNSSGKISGRQREIAAAFLREMDKHLKDILEGQAVDMLEIKEVADILHIHPRHLSTTVKHVTGKSVCQIYEEKLVAIAKTKLEEKDVSIVHIAHLLTYDPSNFTKFFKQYTGQTPSQYRQQFFPSTVKN